MGYLMKEVEALIVESDVSKDLKEVLLHLAQVIEDTETGLTNVGGPEEEEQPR